MGGAGSSRWLGYRRKLTTADVPILDINEFLRAGLLAGRGPVKLALGAGDSAFEVTAKFVLDVDKDYDYPFVELYYNIGSEALGQMIWLPNRPANFGGNRFWLMCPNIADVGHQNTMVTKLYLLPGSKEFACRQCCGLSYRRSKTVSNAAQDAEPEPVEVPEPDYKDLPITDAPILRAQLAREIAEHEDELEALRTQLGRLNQVVIRSRRGEPDPGDLFYTR